MCGQYYWYCQEDADRYLLDTWIVCLRLCPISLILFLILIHVSLMWPKFGRYWFWFNFATSWFHSFFCCVCLWHYLQIKHELLFIGRSAVRIEQTANRSFLCTKFKRGGFCENIWIQLGCNYCCENTPDVIMFVFIKNVRNPTAIKMHYYYFSRREGRGYIVFYRN